MYLLREMWEKLVARKEIYAEIEYKCDLNGEKGVKLTCVVCSVAKVVNNRREADEEGWVYLLNERFFKFLCVFRWMFLLLLFFSADNNRLIY